jgi:hypothetical protein
MILTEEQIYLARERRERERRAIDKFIKSLNMEDHEFKHFNDALGVQVDSKEHYKGLLLKGGFIPYEEAIKIALTTKKSRKEYRASPLLKSFLRHLYSKPKTKNGEIKLSGRELETMRELGVNFDATQPSL